jgi:hypothetical protein
MRVRSTALFGGEMKLDEELLEDIASYCDLPPATVREKLEAGERLRNLHNGIEYYKVD